MLLTSFFFCFCAFVLLVNGAKIRTKGPPKRKTTFPNLFGRKSKSYVPPTRAERRSTIDLPIPKGKFDRYELLNSSTKMYTWILSNLQTELQPVTEILREMVTADFYKELSTRQLGTSLIDQVINRLFRPEWPIDISGKERILLTSFLLAPVYVLSDLERWEELEEYIISKTNLQIDWKSYFLLVKYCLIRPDKESLLDDFEKKGIVPDLEISGIINDFFSGSQGKSSVYDSLIKMFAALHAKGLGKSLFTPEDERKEISVPSRQVRSFLDRLIIQV